MGRVKYNLPGTWWRKRMHHHLDYIIGDVKELPAYASVYGDAKKIHMSSGELFPDFYNNRQFLENIEASANGGAEIKVLFGPAIRVESDKFLRFALAHDNVNLFGRGKRESSHFKIIEDAEGYMFSFVDGPHGPDRQKCKTVLFTKDYMEITLSLENIFNRQISESEPLDKKHLIDKFVSERKANGSEFSGFITEDEAGRIMPATDEQIATLRLAYQP